MLRKLESVRLSMKRESGFTLVELLVVVAIIVALAAVSVVSVSQFAGKGQEGATATELGVIQTAMDTMMADMGITTVTPSVSGGPATQDFSALPTGPGTSPLANYLRDNPTVYYYCWDGAGKVTQLTTAGNCP